MRGQFPNPVPVPEQVFRERKNRLHQLVISSLIGVAIRLAIIVAEFVGVWIFGSASLLMDALSSLLDVIATALLIVCIKLAARPPDTNHPFGHGRFEPLVGLQLGILMAVIGGGMLVRQLFQITDIPPDTTLNAYAWIIPLAAVALLEMCYRIIMGVAKKQHSPALAADAVHYRMDALTSLCAAIALIIGAYLPSWSVAIDQLGAILIALIMIAVGINALRQNLNQLVDRAPEELYFERVRTSARRVKGVKGTEKIRIQLSGPDAHVDIDVEVDPFLSVEVAHTISQKVRVQIQKDWPQVQDVTVHIEPFYPNDH